MKKKVTSKTAASKGVKAAVPAKKVKHAPNVLKNNTDKPRKVK